MAKIIKRVEFILEDGRTLARSHNDFSALELLGLLTFERGRLLDEMFSVPQIDADYDESEVKPDGTEQH
jgi:hypothetical protein